MYSEDVEQVAETLDFIQTRSAMTLRKLQPQVREAERFLLLNQVLENLGRFIEAQGSNQTHCYDQKLNKSFHYNSI